MSTPPTYETRPRRPTGADYCRVFPSGPAPDNLVVETVARVVSRLNHARRDWQRRRHVSVSPIVAAPAGSTPGDLFMPSTVCTSFFKPDLLVLLTAA